VFSLSYIGGCGPATLGKLAEQNTKQMGSSVGEKIQKMANERRDSVGTFKGKIPEGASQSQKSNAVPWFRQDHPNGPDLSLNKLSAERTKYLMEGKKPPT